MPKFYSQDDKEQFEEKVRIIAEEELKDIRHRDFIKSIQNKVVYLKNNPHTNPFISTKEIDDYGYQMDVDTALSLANQEI